MNTSLLDEKEEKKKKGPGFWTNVFGKSNKNTDDYVKVPTE